jgi:hypothetical protein
MDKRRDHHRRVVRRGTLPVAAISPMDTEVQLRDRLHDEPRQVILRRPLPQRRRQKQLLITIAVHAPIFLKIGK